MMNTNKLISFCLLENKKWNGVQTNWMNCPTHNEFWIA
jgi:hypothetical protein